MFLHDYIIVHVKYGRCRCIALMIGDFVFTTLDYKTICIALEVSVCRLPEIYQNPNSLKVMNNLPCLLNIPSQNDNVTYDV